MAFLLVQILFYAWGLFMGMVKGLYGLLEDWIAQGLVEGGLA